MVGAALCYTYLSVEQIVLHYMSSPQVCGIIWTSSSCIPPGPSMKGGCYWICFIVLCYDQCTYTSLSIHSHSVPACTDPGVQ